MYLEVVSPEAILFQGEVESVAVPGVNGAFQMLNNHAPIVSILSKGVIKIFGSITVNDSYKEKFNTSQDGSTTLSIDSGVVEMRDNKLIVLVD